MSHKKVSVIAIGSEEGGTASPPLRVAHALRASGGGDTVDLLIFECAELAFEHTLSILDTQFAIFVVAADDAEEPHRLRELSPADTALAATLHGEVSPAQLIHLLRTMDRNHAAPAGFVLAVSTDGFAAEEGVSVAGQKRVEQAVSLLLELLRDADLRRWRSLLSAG